MMLNVSFPMLRVIAAVAFTFTGGAGFSEAHNSRNGPVLTITGLIGDAEASGLLEVDFEMLEALPVTEFSTTTIWTDGVQTFSGVELSVLIAELGARGTTLTAIAANDYAIEIPISDAVPGGPIVAYKINGSTMNVREKGPLWIVYPYDQKTEYQNEVIYSRSIWQLTQIVVQP